MDSDPKRILVVLPTWVGDTVMAPPTLRALRLRFPRAHIAWMGAPAAVATLAGLEEPVHGVMETDGQKAKNDV